MKAGWLNIWVYKEVFGKKYSFLNVPSVRQGVTIFCAPNNMGTNVYSALKKQSLKISWEMVEKSAVPYNHLWNFVFEEPTFWTIWLFLWVSRYHLIFLKIGSYFTSLIFRVLKGRYFSNHNYKFFKSLLKSKLVKIN